MVGHGGHTSWGLECQAQQLELCSPFPLFVFKVRNCGSRMQVGVWGAANVSGLKLLP